MEQKKKLYPKVDINVWFRSCEKELLNPLEGKVTKGIIPSWIDGRLLQNGPGKYKFGDTKFNHVFDGSALLHRFNIVKGKVSYQCRFLNSQSYEKNQAANKIVVSEIGTVAVSNPCRSIFER